jgi:serine/threonine-protein kinase
MTGDSARRAFGSFGRLGPGSRIAGYVLEEQVGIGATAVVFRARDAVLGRLAAVKVLSPSIAGDEEFRARFLLESRAAAAVDSQHILPVYGAGEDAGLLYIATHFVAGGDLAGLMGSSGGRLAPGQAAALVTQLASALDAAHAAGLVHRDVKPANVLVEKVAEWSWHAYLSDFGLSKRTQSSASLTRTGQFIGTPDYSAPEQIETGLVDGWTDQYALGCMAFALLTGTPPFRRPTAVATLFAQVQAPVPAATAMRPELPTAVDSALARALAKSPGGRYINCSEFAATLREALASARRGAATGSGASLPRNDAALAGAPSAAQDNAEHVTTIAAENASADRSGGVHGLGRRKRGKATAVCAAAAALVLAAGGVTAAMIFASPWKSGPLGQAGSQSPARQTASPAIIRPSTGQASTYRVLTGGSYAFKNPMAVAFANAHIWVVNNTGNSVTELSASNGNWTRTLFGASYGFNVALAIASDGTHLWVTNSGGNSVTELSASDGSWIRTLSGGSYGLNGPQGIASDGTHIWVTNPNGNSVTEVNASDGRWIRTLSGGSYGFAFPEGIASDGTHIWVANAGITSNVGSVTEMNASDGSWIRTLSASTYGFRDPPAIAADGSHLWVVNNQGNSVTELSSSVGSWLRTLSGSRYRFNAPNEVTTDGTHVWVCNTGGASGSLTELNASDGRLTRTLAATSGITDPQGSVSDGTHLWVADGNSSVTELTIK